LLFLQAGNNIETHNMATIEKEAIKILIKNI
jgi:hypothetical protein